MKAHPSENEFIMNFLGSNVIVVSIFIQFCCSIFAFACSVVGKSKNIFRKWWRNMLTKNGTYSTNKNKPKKVTEHISPTIKIPFVRLANLIFLLKSDLTGEFSSMKKDNIRSGGNRPRFGGKMNFPPQIFHLNALRMKHIRNIQNVAEKQGWYLPWEPKTLILRGYDPKIEGLKPSFFMGFGVQR